MNEIQQYSKNIINHIYNSFEKGKKPEPEGTIKEWKGKKYRKEGGKWKQVAIGRKKNKKWNEDILKEPLYTFYHGTNKYDKIKNIGLKISMTEVSDEFGGSAISLTQDKEYANEYGTTIIKTTLHPTDFKNAVLWTLDNYDTLLNYKEIKEIKEILNKMGGIKEIYNRFLNNRKFMAGELAFPHNISANKIKLEEIKIQKKKIK